MPEEWRTRRVDPLDAILEGRTSTTASSSYQPHLQSHVAPPGVPWSFAESIHSACVREAARWNESKSKMKTERGAVRDTKQTGKGENKKSEK